MTTADPQQDADETVDAGQATDVAELGTPEPAEDDDDRAADAAPDEEA